MMKVGQIVVLKPEALGNMRQIIEHLVNQPLKIVGLSNSCDGYFIVDKKGEAYLLPGRMLRKKPKPEREKTVSWVEMDNIWVPDEVRKSWQS